MYLYLQAKRQLKGQNVLKEGGDSVEVKVRMSTKYLGSEIM